MASVQEISPDRYVVQLSSSSESAVTVEVHMSRETADRITALQTARIAQLNPDRDDVPPQTPGSAVLSVLDPFATQATLAELDLSEADVAAAVAWARQAK